MYMARARRVHSLYMAVDGCRCIHGPQAWPCAGYTTVCTVVYPVHDRVQLCTLYTGVFTARVHRRVRTVNTAVYTVRVHGP